MRLCIKKETDLRLPGQGRPLLFARPPPGRAPAHREQQRACRCTLLFLGPCLPNLLARWLRSGLRAVCKIVQESNGRSRPILGLRRSGECRPRCLAVVHARELLQHSGGSRVVQAVVGEVASRHRLMQDCNNDSRPLLFCFSARYNASPVRSKVPVATRHRWSLSGGFYEVLRALSRRGGVAYWQTLGRTCADSSL